MKTSDLGIELIKVNEGYRSLSYKDSGGLDTIGYGHLIKRSDNFDVVIKNDKPHYTITKELAEALLIKDVEWAENIIKLHVDIRKTNQDQFDAFASFVYNLGYKAFQNRDGSKTKILTLHNMGMYGSASKEFLRWVYVGSNVVNGLLNRREREMEMYNGTWKKP